MKNVSDLILYFSLVFLGGILGWLSHGFFYQGEEPEVLVETKIIQKIIEVDASKGDSKEPVVTKELASNPKSLKVGEKIPDQKKLSTDTTEAPAENELVQVFHRILKEKNFVKAGEYYVGQSQNFSTQEKNELADQWCMAFRGQYEAHLKYPFLTTIQNMLDVENGHVGLVVELADVYDQIKDAGEAADLLQKEAYYITDKGGLEKVWKVIRSARNKKINALIAENRGSALEAYLKECMINDPENFFYPYQLGLLYKHLKRVDDALYYLELALTHDDYKADAEMNIQQIVAGNSKPYDQKDMNDNRKEIVIPIQGNDKSFFVEVKLEDKVTASLLIDTGASIGMLSEALAKRLKHGQQGWARYSMFKTAGGMVRKPIMTVEKLQLHTVKAEDLLFSVDEDSDTKIDGLLGMNFLSHFNFEIDPARKVLILRPKFK